MMFTNLFCRMESGKLFFNEKSKTSKKEARENWYMLLMTAISERTKNKMAPRLAAGRYLFENNGFQISMFKSKKK